MILSAAFLAQQHLIMYIIPNIFKYEEARALLKDDMVIIYLRTDMTWAALMMLTVVSGVVVAALVGFGAVYAILRTLRKNAISFSSRTYRLHVQLTVLLLAQLSLPSVFVMFPMMVAVLSMIYHFHLSQTDGRMGFLLFSLYAPVNSFLVILFVTPYRRFTDGCIRRVVPQRLGTLFGKPNEVVPAVDQSASTSAAMRVLRRGGIMSRIMYEAA
ncbi:hypothetical protein AAVH_12536 [Aphelenchoides avenae]|nr:hypothetical protein AAVH_12536 [Aphelenchus avenae]